MFQIATRKAKNEDKNETESENSTGNIFFTPFSWRTPSRQEHPGPPLVLFRATINREREAS